MSLRQQNLGSFIKPGFNPLAAPTPSYTYYLQGMGQNNYGQLGIGTSSNVSSPNQIGTLTDWSIISAGYQHGVAIKTDGTLWAWGRNADGQLGIGNTTNYSSPIQVGALTTWLNVSCGNYHTMAVKTDGTLWTWGRNDSGQLGINNTIKYSSPKQVGALTNWFQPAGASISSLALKTDGTLWSWGAANDGILGLNISGTYSSPRQIGALTTWLSISCGYNIAVGIQTNGTAWSWGYNGQGGLGQGNTLTISSPKQIGALTNWSNVGVGKFSSGGFCQAVKTDGTLWSWGMNRYGQLGLGTSTYYSTISSPNQVGSLATWSRAYCGGEFSVAVKTDKTLWVWGRSNSGQLGLGNTTSYSSPKQLGSGYWGAVACGFNFTIAEAV